MSEHKVGRVIRPKETAVRLGVCVKTIRRLEQRGLLHRTQVTDTIHGFTDAEIDRFIAERTRGGR